MSNKRNKILIGLILFIGFVLYTQYEKSAEPTWKINEENFVVMNDWEELMDREKSKFSDLKFAEHFKLLRNSHVSIPLANDQRTFQVERIYDFGQQLYLLYSVDLIERDKEESDVPRLTFNQVEITSKKGKTYTFPIDLYEGEGGTGGVVYKHKLYRSMMIHAQYDNVKTDEEWKEVFSSETLNFLNPTFTSNNGKIKIDLLTFKVKPHHVFEIPPVLASETIDRSLQLYNNEKIQLDQLEVYQMGARIKIDSNINKDLVSLFGTIEGGQNQYTLNSDITGGEDTGYFMETYFVLDELLNMKQADSLKMSLTHSIHRTNKSYSFSVPQQDIEKFTKNQKTDVTRNQLIANDKDYKVIFKGITNDISSDQKGIEFSIESKTGKIAQEEYLYFQPSVSENRIPNEERFMNNLVTIKNSSGKTLQNFDVMQTFDNEQPGFLLIFHEGLPKDDLTVTLSRLTQVYPLKEKGEVPLKLPTGSKK
ncbi:hypothetical protein [Fictibacillus phosphorivorans]|uniref:hypothetical protein n=1 Tax=Fictibacillus phosphorivorans TaxID=1221500 RepID=UPI001293A946|nr:hypothetical protein [Fictibacillus phosphorivorans]MQR96367.1 hypothetical protein [Fictibacillus phosphorivorans]